MKKKKIKKKKKKKKKNPTCFDRFLRSSSGQLCKSANNRVNGQIVQVEPPSVIFY
jgi:hypothetical protein